MTVVLRAREDAALVESAGAIGRDRATADVVVIGHMAVRSHVRRLLMAEATHVWWTLDPDRGFRAFAAGPA